MQTSHNVYYVNSPRRYEVLLVAIAKRNSATHPPILSYTRKLVRCLVLGMTLAMCRASQRTVRFDAFH